jgi:hypothetical protein
MLKDELANKILKSKAFFALMHGSEHVEDYVESLRPAWVEWRRAGGRAWGEAPEGDIFLQGKTAEELAGPLASDGGPVRVDRWRG